MYDSTNGSCQNAITQIDANIVIGYSGNGQYKIMPTSTINFVTSTVNNQAVIKTNIVVKGSAISNSGNPGYIIGKPVQYASGGIYQIASLVDGSCLATNSFNTSNTLPIYFGINQTYICRAVNPCVNPLYVDALPTNSFAFQKYATQST